MKNEKTLDVSLFLARPLPSEHAPMFGDMILQRLHLPSNQKLFIKEVLLAHEMSDDISFYIFENELVRSKVVVLT